jgi:hypothetical protein
VFNAHIIQLFRDNINTKMNIFRFLLHCEHTFWKWVRQKCSAFGRAEGGSWGSALRRVAMRVRALSCTVAFVVGGVGHEVNHNKIM